MTRIHPIFPVPFPGVSEKGSFSSCSELISRSRILMEGQIVHAGHPVLRWMAGNVVIETDT
ncbi:MAG: hypothetical protein ACI4DZ_07105 [Oliverpabstia sp.]